MRAYILQLIICSGILYAYYHFFLRNERFHQYNRFYLLLIAPLSIILPALSIPAPFPATDNLIVTRLVLFTPDKSIPISKAAITDTSKSDTIQEILLFLSLIITAVLIFRLFIAIKKIVLIKRSSANQKMQAIIFVLTDDPRSPFSFFKWLFWNKKISLQSSEGQQIMEHELYHIRHKHSCDLLFMELLLSVFWFNPFYYLLRREISAIQEFLADKHVTQTGSIIINKSIKWDLCCIFVNA